MDALPSPASSLPAPLLLPEQNTCPAVGFPLLLLQCSFAGGGVISGFNLKVPQCGVFFLAIYLIFPAFWLPWLCVGMPWLTAGIADCWYRRAVKPVEQITPPLNCFMLI